MNVNKNTGTVMLTGLQSTKTKKQIVKTIYHTCNQRYTNIKQNQR